MKNFIGGFIVLSIIFGPLFGWKGLVGAALVSLSLWFSELPESEPPVSAEKRKSSHKDDLDLSIIAALCSDE